jgi:hypothetical protein
MSATDTAVVRIARRPDWMVRGDRDMMRIAAIRAGRRASAAANSFSETPWRTCIG